MSDFEERNFNTGFQGLVNTTAIFAGVGGAAIVGYEVLRQLRRLPRVQFIQFWKQKRKKFEGDGGADGGLEDEDAVHGPGIGSQSKLTCEDWEMGHLYQARMFHATTPSPPLARWPFAWVKQAIQFTDQFYAEHTGMDVAVYVRFLRACLYWTFLHTVTTAPILLAIHIRFSKGVAVTDMSRASLSYLVTVPGPGCADISDQDCARKPNDQGRSLLWIHLCLLWYITITWIYALFGIAKGSLRLRRGLIDKTRKRLEQSRQDATKDRHRAAHIASELSGPPAAAVGSAQGMPADTSDGWRQRTLMVMNLPPTMRDEASIRRYFEEFLRPDDASIISVDTDHSSGDADYRQGRLRRDPEEAHHEGSGDSEDTTGKGSTTLHYSQAETLFSRKTLPTKLSDEVDDDDSRHSSQEEAPRGLEADLMDRHLKSPVQTVVLVRKMNELSSMLGRRQDVLNQLEAAHMKLAQNVLATVGRRAIKLRRKAKRKEAASSFGADEIDASTGHRRSMLDELKRPLNWAGFGKRRSRPRKESFADDALDTSEPASGHQTPDQLEIDLEKMAPTKLTAEAEAKIDDLARGLARFSPGTTGLQAKELFGLTDEEWERHEMHQTVWEALAQVPRELLDPYQPVTRLSALFLGQTVPTIDYLLTKLNLLTALVTEMRARLPTSYEPTSTAFVTFRDPRQARMVWRELKSQIVVKVRMAPEVKDLDWERLMRTSFTGDLVRGIGVNAGFWAFTIFWVVIINLITNTLFSVQSLKKVLPGVRAFFDSNKNFEAFLSITLPTVIVSLITMAIPELIFQTSKRVQGFVTFSALYDMCLTRYWKFVICNVVILFCVGVTTVKAILSQLDESGRILDNIAFSFPSAAPFFVSYMILQLAFHSGFEHVGFMVALLQHLGARKAVTPRMRALKTLPRNFNRYYWLPLHINIMAIQFIFAVLNPLVIPFALVYMSVALVVFKKNFAYHYYRRFNEMQGVVYFTRILRYSLDALVVMQAVLLIFFSVTHQGSVYIGMTSVLIPLTVIVKLLATRLWKSQCRAVEDEEAEALCGIDSRPLRSGGQQDREYGKVAHDDAQDSRSPLDARASGRYPSIIPPPETGSRFYQAWQRIHDSFNANGLDKASYVATAQAKGHALHNPLELGAKTLVKAPELLVKRTAVQGRHLTSAAKQHLGLDPLANDSRTSVDPKGVRPSTDSDRFARGPHRSSRPKSGLDKASRSISFSNRPDKVQMVDDVKVEENDHRRQELRVTRAVSKRRKGDYGRSRASTMGLTRGNSTRSEERPFLSGYDAVSAHAPVPSEDDADLSFADGDEPFLELYEEHARSHSIKRQSSRCQPYAQSALKKSRAPFGIAEAESGERLDAAVPKLSQLGGPQRKDALARKMAEESRFFDDADGERLPSVQKFQFSHSDSSRRSDSERRPQPHGFDSGRGSDDSREDVEDGESDDDQAVGILIQGHAPVRWDDTPSHTARYNNPFYNRELDSYLWLPRDPLAPLDLFDTVEWHGPAFVSSQGGPGRVGEWDDDDDDDDPDEAETEFGDDDIRFGGEAAHDKFHRFDLLDGNEEIIVSDVLAKHLDQEEDVQDAPDPAASLPKNLMEDYKKALRKSSRSESDEDATERQPSDGDTHMFGSRRSQISMGGESFKSPTLSARRIIDDRFAGLEPLDLSSGSFCASATSEAEMSAPLSARADGSAPEVPQRRSSVTSSYRISSGPSPARQREVSIGARDPLAPAREEEDRNTAEADSTDPTSLTIEAGAGTSAAAGGTLERPTTAETTEADAADRSRRAMMVSPPGVSFAPPDPSEVGTTIQRKQHPHGPTHPRRTGSGAYSQGGYASSLASTNANRVVTLRAALKAEALEEERRFTLKERLTKRGKKQGRATKDEQDDLDLDDEKGQGDVDGNGSGHRRGGGSLHRAGTIMARYEARQKRRRENASEFGMPTSIEEGSEATGANRTDSSGGARRAHLRDASAPSWTQRSGASSGFRASALGALGIGRAHSSAAGGRDKAQSSVRLARARDQWNQRNVSGQAMQMTEFGKGPARPATADAEASGQPQPLWPSGEVVDGQTLPERRSDTPRVPSSRASLADTVRNERQDGDQTPRQADPSEPDSTLTRATTGLSIGLAAALAATPTPGTEEPQDANLPVPPAAIHTDLYTTHPTTEKR